MGWAREWGAVAVHQCQCRPLGNGAAPESRGIYLNLYIDDQLEDKRRKTHAAALGMMAFTFEI